MILEKKISDFGVKRKFQYDYYIDDINTVIEVNGGSRIPGGRHTFGDTYERDLMKINLTQQLGIKIYQFTYEMLSREEYKLFV